MDPFISYVLRYLPLFVAIVVLPFTIIIRYFKKIVHLFIYLFLSYFVDQKNEVAA